MTQSVLPTFADILNAQTRIASRAVVTPLVEFPVLNERVGGRVLLKLEMFQRTGSFKFRGAFNLVSEIADAEPGRPVIAFSSGNHAQAVAAAAALRGLKATIVMPADAPLIKRERTAAFGADVVLYDRMSEDREAIARRIAQQQGAALVPPFDHPRIIAGQGTIGLEIAEEAHRRGIAVDAVLVPASGGGLVAGVSLAMRELSPASEIYGVEPAGFDDLARSLASGSRERNASPGGSICDALLTPSPGELTFAINRRTLTGALAVGDDDVRAAIAYAFRELKLVVEPGGVVPLAALLAGGIDGGGRTLALVLSGGNVDPALYAEIIRTGAE